MKPKLPLSLLWDALGLAGLLAIGVGLWLMWPPAAWVAGGAVMLAAGIWGALRCS